MSLKQHTTMFPLFSLLSDAQIVRWSPEGDKYVVVIDDKVDIYDLATASLTGTMTNPKRISSIKFITVRFHSYLDFKKST